jgi:hypothetical protein
MADTPSSATAVLTVALWTDAWQTVQTDDRTTANGAAFAKGGSVTWRQPAEWVERSVNSIGPRYWARLTVSAALTAGAKAGQVGVIRRSLFCAPTTYKALAWIFRAAPAAQDGPWRDKAAYYDDLAETALSRALDNAGGEFDTVIEDDVIDTDEAAQTAAEAGGGAWVIERG